MNVLHLNPTITWRGGEQQTLYLAQYLQSKNITQYVAGNPNSELQKRCQNLNIPFLTVKIHGEWDILASFQLKKLILKHKIQILHAHTAKAHTIALLTKKLIPKNYKLKLIISRRVDFSFKKSKWNFINKIIEKKYYSDLIDCYIAISKNVKNILIKDGIQENKIEVIYSGIDLNRFKTPVSREKLNQLKKEFNIKKEIIIGNVAALVDHKDHKTLLYAISILNKEFPLSEWKVLIVGDGELKLKLIELANTLNIHNKVHFTGYRKDVFEIFHLFDIFAMSSKEEGLGTSLLDAMALGLPIVATEGGGIPEIVIHNKGGLLSPIKNPELLAKNLKKLLTNANLRKKYSKFNLEFVKNFDFHQTGKKTLELYQFLLKKT